MVGSPLGDDERLEAPALPLLVELGAGVEVDFAAPVLDDAVEVAELVVELRDAL
jgi:hypothetical protein